MSYKDTSTGNEDIVGLKTTTLVLKTPPRAPGEFVITGIVITGEALAPCCWIGTTSAADALATGRRKKSKQSREVFVIGVFILSR